MKNQKVELRGETIYASELKAIAKANKIDFKQNQDDVIKQLDAIDDGDFISVNPGDGKAVKDTSKLILEMIAAKPGISCKDIAAEAFLNLKTVGNTLTKLNSEEKVTRAFDDKRVLRYYVNGAAPIVEKKAAKKSEKKSTKKSVEKKKKIVLTGNGRIRKPKVEKKVEAHASGEIPDGKKRLPELKKRIDFESFSKRKDVVEIMKAKTTKSVKIYALHQISELNNLEISALMGFADWSGHIARTIKNFKSKKTLQEKAIAIFPELK